MQGPCLPLVTFNPADMLTTKKMHYPIPIFLLFVLLTRSSACKCSIQNTFQAIKEVPTVLKGTMVSSEVNRKYRIIFYKFRLLKVFKGCPPKTTMFELQTHYGGSCRTGFFIGETHLLNLGHEEVSIFAPDKMVYNIHICQHHKSFSELSTQEKKLLHRISKKKGNKCMKQEK